MHGIELFFSNTLFGKKVYSYFLKEHPKVLEYWKIHPKNFDFNKFQKKYFTVDYIQDISANPSSNVTNKSIARFKVEMITPFIKYLTFSTLFEKMVEMYGINEATEYSKMLLDGTFYLHDTAAYIMPYCLGVDFSKLLLEGMPYGQLHSLPPKKPRTFINQVKEAIIELSSEFAGAIAFPSLIVLYTYIYLKYYGKDHKINKKEVEDDFQNLVHTINKEMRNGTECVDEETEVLTPEGFKSWKDLKVGDGIYVWKNGKLAIEKVLKVNVYDYEGTMHIYEGRNYIQQVTPNHLVLRRKYNEEGYILQPSEEIIDFNSPIYFPVAFEDLENNEGINLTNEEIEFLVFILTEGSIDKDKLVISKSPNRWGNDRLKEILEKLGIKYRIYKRKESFGCQKHYGKYEVFIYQISKGQISKYLAILNNTKRDIPDIFLKMNKEQSRLFLKTWAKLDGYTTIEENKKEKTFRMRLQCDNFIIADKLQHIAVRAGWASRITIRRINNNKKETIYLIVYNQKNKSATRKYKIHYKGKVWCPTTNAGIVVYRKGGKIFISGNSPFSNLSFFDRYILDELLTYVYSYFTNEIGDKELFLKRILEIQEIVMEFLCKGDPITKAPYRFPVLTSCFIKDKKTGKILDREFLDLVAKNNTKGQMNIYVSDDARKYSMCCRVISDYSSVKFDSFGNGGINVGSARVLTINLNRIALEVLEQIGNDFDIDYKTIYLQKLKERMNIAKKILDSFRECIRDFIKQGCYRFFNLGWFDLDKHFYSTIGFIGLYEALRTLDEDLRSSFAIDILETMDDMITEFNKNGKIKYNLEQVPGESAAGLLPSLDKYFYGEEKVPYVLYSNQFVPLYERHSILDKIEIEGKYFKYLSGGGISHINILHEMKPEEVKFLIELCVEKGIEHFALNPVYSICENGHYLLGKYDECYICGAKIKDHLTRVVGFFTPVSAWGERRRKWEFSRRVWNTLEGSMRSE